MHSGDGVTMPLISLRRGIRALRNGRGVSILAVLAYALGIGVTAAFFTVFYGVQVKPLPYPDPDALVLVYDVQPACKICPASFEKYAAWRTRNHVFQAMGGSFTRLAVVRGIGDPERVPVARATHTMIDGDPHEIVGVMPSWFAHRNARLFLPVRLRYDNRNAAVTSC